jgi:four helix bundle protein
MSESNLANEVEERLIDFAVRVIRLTDALPKTPVGKHISNQLLRSGTSPAPNYAEARGAESSRDFIHKLKITLKELNESSVWLRMIIRAELLEQKMLADLLDENQQLCRIRNASVKTAKARKNDK